MGLLDNLLLSQGANFGGQNGGLLDFLSRTVQQNNQYQPSAGFAPMDANEQMQAAPIGIGGYQMPRIGASAQFAPDPAAIPQNAQPAQGQLPPQAPPTIPSFLGGQQGAGIGDRLMAGVQNFANAGGPLQALAGGLSGLVSGTRTDPAGAAQQNQRALFEAYKGAGLSPQQAMVAVLNPAAANTYIGGGQTDDIKEYQFAKKEDPSLSFEKFMARKKATSGEYSLTPQYGTNEKGETVLLQTGKSGEAIQTKLPAGVKVSSGVEKIDLGTSWGLVDKRTGTLVGQQAKDVAGKASQEAQGEAQGKAIVALPTVINTTEQSIKLVDEMIKHPGRETATGLSGTLDPRNYLGGTDAKDFIVRAKQIEGRTFLSAFDQLRGAGAITEAEGGKATAAMARLDRSQSDSEYLAALNELKGILHKGMEIARQKAGQGSQPTAAPAQAATDLKAKYGLD